MPHCLYQIQTFGLCLLSYIISHHSLPCPSCSCNTELYLVPCIQRLFLDISNLISLSTLFLLPGMTYLCFFFTWLIPAYSSDKTHATFWKFSIIYTEAMTSPLSQESLCLSLSFLVVHLIIIICLSPSLTVSSSIEVFLYLIYLSSLLHSGNYKYF